MGNYRGVEKPFSNYECHTILVPLINVLGKRSALNVLCIFNDLWCLGVGGAWQLLSVSQEDMAVW